MSAEKKEQLMNNVVFLGNLLETYYDVAMRYDFCIRTAVMNFAQVLPSFMHVFCT